MVLSAVMFALFAGEAMESGTDFPSAYDLRNYGYVPTVMDQGKDQTCWTFAAMTAIKSNYLMNVAQGNYNNFLGSDSDLSELHLAWFSFKNPNRKQNFAFIKNGNIVADPADEDVLNHPDNPQVALAFLTRQDGPVRESELPYSGPKPSAGTSPRDYKPVLRLTGANYIDSEGLTLTEEVTMKQEDVIKAGLMSRVAINTGVYWNKSYMSNKFAYYNPSTSGGGHAVTIIGWDDNYSRENFGFIKPKNKGAWLVQNSWGTDWGNDGCFWMSYEQFLRYAMVFSSEAANPRVREYYHDDLGFTHEVLLKDIDADASDDMSASVVNVFKVKGDHEKLREIGFYSTSSIFDASMLVFDIGTENSPEILRNALDFEHLKTMNFFDGLGDKGYVLSVLDEPVALSKDHYFAIVMVIRPSADSSQEGAFKPTIAAEVQIPNHRTANAEINAGETYFSTDSMTWKDAKYHQFIVGDAEVTGFNACIKGFTYIPNERMADDWAIISEDKRAQLSISLLRESAANRISVKGRGLSNIVYKVVPEENADTGGASGKFYTLKLICDVENFDTAAITSLLIDGQETITGYVDVPASLMPTADRPDLTLTEWKHADITKTGVEFKYMTAATGTIESTDGYTANNGTVQVNEPSPNNDNTPSENTGGGSGGGGGGCDAGDFCFRSWPDAVGYANHTQSALTSRKILAAFHDCGDFMLV